MSADARLTDRAVAPTPRFARCLIGDDVLLGVSATLVDQRRDQAYVVVSGVLCPASVSTLANLLDALIRDGTTQLHVDLSNLDLCTSHGVDVLEDARRRVEERNGSLRMVGAHGVVRRVLDVLLHIPAGLDGRCRPRDGSSMSRRDEPTPDVGRLRIDQSAADPVPWKRGAQEIDAATRSPALLVVPDTDPSRRLPLLVFLHGAGGDGRQSIGLIGAAAARRDTVVLAPTSDGHTWDQLGAGFGPDVAALESALQRVLRQWPVDTNRLAIGGFSDGASYALSVGLANGDLFTHVLACSPGFAAPPSQVGAPSVFVSHGVHDSVLPIAATSRRVVPMLERSGYDVHYEEFDGDHGVPPMIVDQALDHFLGYGSERRGKERP